MIEGYVGLPGAGKTYAMVRRMIGVARAKKDVRIASNMGLDVERLRGLTGWRGEYQELRDWPDLVEIRRSLVLIDELNLWMPSRVWNKLPAQLLWSWAQVRKSRLTIWWTAQAAARVDKVVRELTFSTGHMASFVRLGFFVCRWRSGMGGNTEAVEFVPFRRSYAAVYNTEGFVRTASFVSKAWE